MGRLELVEMGGDLDVSEVSSPKALKTLFQGGFPLSFLSRPARTVSLGGRVLSRHSLIVFCVSRGVDLPSVTLHRLGNVGQQPWTDMECGANCRFVGDIRKPTVEIFGYFYRRVHEFTSSFIAVCEHQETSRIKSLTRCAFIDRILNSFLELETEAEILRHRNAGRRGRICD